MNNKDNIKSIDLINARETINMVLEDLKPDGAIHHKYRLVQAKNGLFIEVKITYRNCEDYLYFRTNYPKIDKIIDEDIEPVNLITI